MGSISIVDVKKKEVIDNYLKIIEELESQIDYDLPTTLHCLYMHPTEYTFYFYGWNNFDRYEESRDLLNDLTEEDHSKIARFFKLGVLNEKLKKDCGQCFTKDMESYKKGMEYRRVMTTEEKRMFLYAMNSIYGSEDRTEAIRIVFREKHTFKQLETLLTNLLIKNQNRILEQRRVESESKNKKVLKIKCQYTDSTMKLDENNTWEGFILVGEALWFKGLVKDKDNFFDKKYITGSLLYNEGISMIKLTPNKDFTPIQLYGVNKDGVIDGFWDSFENDNYGNLVPERKGLIRIETSPETVSIRKLNSYANDIKFWEDTYNKDINKTLTDYLNENKEEIVDASLGLIKEQRAFDDVSEFEKVKKLTPM